MQKNKMILDEIKPSKYFKNKIKELQQKIEYLQNELERQKIILIRETNNLREIALQESQKYEPKIDKLNQLIGILKTGRIKYESQIYHKISNNLPVNNTAVEKVSGVIFLKEIQQVEVRIDHILIVTNSGREIFLGKQYDYLEDLFVK